MIVATVRRTPDKKSYTVKPKGPGGKIVTLPRPLGVGFAGLSEDAVEMIANCRKHEEIDLPYKDVLRLETLYQAQQKN